MTVHSSERARDTLGRPIAAKAADSLHDSHISGDKNSSRREISLRFDYRKGAELLNSGFGRNRSHGRHEVHNDKAVEVKGGEKGPSNHVPQPKIEHKVSSLNTIAIEAPPQVKLETRKAPPVEQSVSGTPPEIKNAAPLVTQPVEVTRKEPTLPAPAVAATPLARVQPVREASAQQITPQSVESVIKPQQKAEMTPTMKQLVDVVNNSTLDRQIGSPRNNPILEFSDKDHDTLKAMLMNPEVKRELLSYSDQEIRSGFEAVRPERIKYLHEWLAMNHRDAVKHPGLARSLAGITPTDTNRIGQVVEIARDVASKNSSL